MIFRLALVCSVITLGLSGCASKMPEDVYNKLALKDVLTSLCLQNNFINYQQAGQERSNISYFLSTWSYDRNNYQTWYSAHMSQYSTAGGVTESTCNELNAQIYTDTMEAQANRQQRQADIQGLNQSIQNMNNSMPKTTFCNRYGTQVMCSTY